LSKGAGNVQFLFLMPLQLQLQSIVAERRVGRGSVKRTASGIHILISRLKLTLNFNFHELGLIAAPRRSKVLLGL